MALAVWRHHFEENSAREGSVTGCHKCREGRERTTTLAMSMSVKKILLAAVAASAITGSALADEPTTTFELGGFLLAWLGPDGHPLNGIALDRLIGASIGKDAFP